jgi:hypothetical protein
LPPSIDACSVAGRNLEGPLVDRELKRGMRSGRRNVPTDPVVKWGLEIHRDENASNRVCNRFSAAQLQWERESRIPDVGIVID